jgi:hypothetical protein
MLVQENISFDSPSLPTDPKVLEQIPSMYSAVLDHLLTLPHVKANLIKVNYQTKPKIALFH